MPLVSRVQLRRELGLRTGWLLDEGNRSTTSAGAAGGTTIIDTVLYSSIFDQKVRPRSVVSIIGSGNARRGERRLATGPADSAGTVTVSPAFGGQVATSSAYEIWIPEALHPDDIDRCIDRALQRACWFWRPTPLTVLRGADGEDDDGALAISGGNVVIGSTTVWTATTCTPTIQSLSPPEEFMRRVIRVTATASPGYLQSPDIEVDEDNKSAWRIRCRARSSHATFASQDARIVLYDVTNSAVFAADTDPLNWTRRAWGILDSAFTIPNNCDRFAVRLEALNNAAVADFAGIQVWQTGNTRWSLPRRIQSKRHVGPVFVDWGTIHGQTKRQEYRGTIERRDVSGRGVSLETDAPGSQALWYYEKASYDGLTTSGTPVSTDDDTQTPAALEWVVVAALVECYKLLDKRDEVSDPGRWTQKLQEAQAELISMQADYGIEPMATEDSALPIGRAILRV